ncbi:LOW QUALITY PROTEIN: hypothetical protein U9M48_028824, partial [Paspalum notatum var. saurae]
MSTTLVSSLVQVRNCDSVDNNICEYFNKWIVNARFFPIITMLEDIRIKVIILRKKSTHVDTGRCLNSSVLMPTLLMSLRRLLHSRIVQKIYNHCLEPVEGMHSWHVSDMPKLRAPSYIRMPGKPKTERRREPQEKPKAKN